MELQHRWHDVGSESGSKHECICQLDANELKLTNADPKSTTGKEAPIKHLEIDRRLYDSEIIKNSELGTYLYEAETTVGNTAYPRGYIKADHVAKIWVPKIKYNKVIDDNGNEIQYVHWQLPFLQVLTTQTILCQLLDQKD